MGRRNWQWLELVDKVATGKSSDMCTALQKSRPFMIYVSALDAGELYFGKSPVDLSRFKSTPEKTLKSRPFMIYVSALDAGELYFGKSPVDLSQLVQEYSREDFEGTRVKQWDASFDLFDKAKGRELIQKLRFQNMEKNGGISPIGICSQVGEQKLVKGKNYSFSITRKNSQNRPSVSLAQRCLAKW
ncbi:hypothetical protein ACH5RR_029512 [Cinchona calisaya]|uniref:Uncharacterized protein n=1 Tax=Cinchona calisaya TaxID=153742 RepID=A0ABD2YRV6_9GENT